MINTDTYLRLSFEDFKSEILNDYKIAVISRECSFLGRKEVLNGKAKFGIFGDGKEAPQLAMAKAFKNGDFRSGYYRDQTFMMAVGLLTVEQFFSGLYGNTNTVHEPMSGGRQMGAHFATQSLEEDGSWKNLTVQKNSSADTSPTASQMPRLLGLAHASKIYRNISGVKNKTNFSINGNEISWGTIGDASTSEGVFFETINAAGVLQVPMVISIWDDRYGISVNSKYQTTKENISEILKGFQRDQDQKGYEIFKVKGWDYPELIATYENAAKIAREEHIPVLIHVMELTQPQGHSSSGSHERYKSKDFLEWEAEFDCLVQMKNWIIKNNIASEEEIITINSIAKQEVLDGKKAAWDAYLKPIKDEQKELVDLLEKIPNSNNQKTLINTLISNLTSVKEANRKSTLMTARKVLRLSIDEKNKVELAKWIKDYTGKIQPKFSSHLYSESNNNIFSVQEVKPSYSPEAEEVDGRIIIRDNFEALFKKHPTLLTFGEDSGKIGDVNQGLEGLQEKFGELRISDVGIRETTILGQGIGIALRGLRPIAEIQYLDYLLYAIQVISDDLATLQYRTCGRQKAPLIIRTRGHRLEGIWHSGSPMGMIINALRGIRILVPRNMTKAAGFYNSLLETDEPALVIECLNGYRLKEKKPNNIGEFKTPIGVVETVKNGKDITLVSYGSTLRLVEEAAKELLEETGIDAEVIDIQSLLPFDIHHDIVKSIAKTNRLLVIDEDVPGGASAFILEQIITVQNAYRYLDSRPETLTSKEHRPAYGTDGDYFSKPSVEDIYEKVYSIMHEASPDQYPSLY